MANPLYHALNSAQSQQGGPMNMIQAFQQFMQQNQGKSPNEFLQKQLSSGRFTQDQLNQAQQMAKQIEGPLSGLRSMFGFK